MNPDSNDPLHLFLLELRNRERRRVGGLPLEGLRRRRRMAVQDNAMSSDSEVDDLAGGVKNGKMDVNTPAASTPQELIKLDP